MKNLFLLFFSFLALSVNAQTAKKATLTFGGIENGSTVSIMQLRDYPVLMTTNKTSKIKSYEFTVIQDGATESPSFKIEGPELNKTAMNYLENLQGKNGKIYIQAVYYEGVEASSDDDAMILTFTE